MTAAGCGCSAWLPLCLASTARCLCRHAFTAHLPRAHSVRRLSLIKAQPRDELLLQRQWEILGRVVCSGWYRAGLRSGRRARRCRPSWGFWPTPLFRLPLGPAEQEVGHGPRGEPSHLIRASPDRPASPLFPQGLCRSRAARRPTRANMSVWPPTAPASATPRLPTSTCEVGNAAPRSKAGTCPVPSPSLLGLSASGLPCPLQT